MADNPPPPPPPPPPPAPVPPAPAVPFALAPGMFTQRIIDYSTPMGLKIWQTLTAPLADKFDGSESKVHGFVQEVKLVIIERGWTEINSLQDGEDEPIYDWLDHYADITHERLYDHCLEFANGHVRAAQESYAMFTFLKDSLDAEFLVSVTNDDPTQPYTIGGHGVGPLFLKKILSAAHYDLIGTGAVIRDRLINLPTYIAEAKFDVEAFNKYVNKQVDQLKARNEQCSDLLHYLFNAYKKVPDESFAKYIADKEEKYHEGETRYTPSELMQFALNKFALLKQEDKWLKRSQQAEEVFALAAQVEALKKQNLQLQGHLKKVGGQRKKSDGKTKPKGKPKSDEEKGKRKQPAWKLKFEGPTKVKDGKTYFWCQHHIYYCLHKTSECSMPTKDKEKSEAPKESDTATGNAAVTAVQAVMQLMGTQQA
jgi:hypothetical protein